MGLSRLPGIQHRDEKRVRDWRVGQSLPWARAQGGADGSPECRESDREVFTNGPQLRDLNTINRNRCTWDFHSVRLKMLKKQVEECPLVKEQQIP